MLVIDASVALAWLFDDERHVPAMAWLDQVAASRAIVPAHWWLEVTNALVTAKRRHRLRRDPEEMLAPLRSLPIEIDLESAAQASSAIVALALERGLTTYDGAYLELALRRQLPLATLDTTLAAAARAAGAMIAPGG
jgi:predicted nucleic acid-binding protein